jgi:3-isopropylmalate dehydrogenase
VGQFNILVLPGDGIGPEVTGAARRVLDTVGSKYGHTFSFSEDIVGGIAIDRYGHPLRVETVQAAKRSDAVLFGAVGGPKWDNAPIRPEAAILGLRKALGLFANLRPITVLPGMEGSSPLKDERVKGTDIIIIRELTGGLYFAKPKRRWTTSQGRRGVDTLRYTEREVERVVRVAFELAQGRRKKVTSVDKANVLESSKLWREVATEVGMDYPEVELEHALVDSCAMQLIANPTRFDVMVMENMFGDILSDEAAVVVASLGMLPSASLAGLPRFGGGRVRTVMGLYEPIHGTAPDIAGQGKANPIGTILSASLMLRYSLGLEIEAEAMSQAVEQVLKAGLRTPDIAAGGVVVSTEQMTEGIIQRLV